MSPQRRRILALAGVAAGLIGLSSAADFAPRIVYNASASAPIGFYFVDTARAYRRADMVIVRVPAAFQNLVIERGYLGPDVPLQKTIAAVGGDYICADGIAVWINGMRVAEVLAEDGLGRPMPVWKGCRRLQEGEFFLLQTGVAASFDSRYFGPVTRADIIGGAIAIRSVFAR